MARALECPACGHRHRLDAVPGSATFRCEECGQTLKAPAAVSSHPDAPAPPARSGAPPSRAAEPASCAAEPASRAAEPSATAAAPATVAPPRRTSDEPAVDRTRVAPVRAAAGVSATVAATAPAENGDAPDRRARRNQPRRSEPTPAAAASRTKVHWYWRLLAWIVAVPLGFLITAWPAYKFGFISKDDLLDIFVGTGIGRYVRLGCVTLAWAIVTALLVQLLVEGGRMRADRKRRARASAAAPSA